MTLLVPDVAFLRFDRLATVPREHRERPTIAPDIAVEVWSPTNDRDFIDGKIRKYLFCGTTLVLDVDPRARTIVAIDSDGRQTCTLGETFARDSVPWLRFAVDDAFVGIEYFE